MIFYVVELLDDWNVDVPSWKYPRNFESPRVSSPGFGNDSKMMMSNGQIEAHEVYHSKMLSCTHVVILSFEYHTDDSMIWLVPTQVLIESTLGTVMGHTLLSSSTSLARGLVSSTAI
ncbi:transposable element Tcb1 transposase [Trichonephila clavipes]|nr:transposable element Tcb1 transposase [Trichonephila clavipes]